MDKIVLRDLAFYGYHGVLPEENRIGQKFTVQLTLFLDTSAAGRSDNVADTVNYALVYDRIRQVVEGPAHRLIEKVAEEIARDLLGNYPLLHGVGVEVEKPGAPIPGIFGNVAVAIERWRQQPDAEFVTDASSSGRR